MLHLHQTSAGHSRLRVETNQVNGDLQTSLLYTFFTLGQEFSSINLRTVAFYVFDGLVPSLQV